MRNTFLNRSYVWKTAFFGNRDLPNRRPKSASKIISGPKTPAVSLSLKT